jgi:hypothetical protein
MNQPGLARERPPGKDAAFRSRAYLISYMNRSERLTIGRPNPTLCGKGEIRRDSCLRLLLVRTLSRFCCCRG